MKNPLKSRSNETESVKIVFSVNGIPIVAVVNVPPRMSSMVKGDYLAQWFTLIAERAVYQMVNQVWGMGIYAMAKDKEAK